MFAKISRTIDFKHLLTKEEYYHDEIICPVAANHKRNKEFNIFPMQHNASVFRKNQALKTPTDLKPQF